MHDGVKRLVAGAMLVAWVAATAAAGAVEWPMFVARKVDLPATFRPVDFNDRGELAGFRLLDSRQRWGQEQLGWRRLEGQEALVVRDLPQGDRHGALLAIGHTGLAAGYGTGAGKADRGHLDHDAPNGARAMTVTPAGEVVQLAPLLPQGLDSIAFDVNRGQQVLGSIYRWTERRGFRAKPFVWSAEAGVQYPLGLDDDGISFRAAAMNDHGQIAGTRSIYPIAWIWDPLEGLRVIDAGIQVVRALNNHGVMIGDGSYRKAFVWHRSRGLRFLPPVEPGGIHRCDAADINDAGWIVGVCSLHPTLWIPDAAGNYAAGDLKDLVAPADRELLSRVSWSEAVKVGNDGSILVHTWEDDPLRFEDAPSASLILTPVAR